MLMSSASLKTADGDRLIVCEQDLRIDTKSYYELQTILVILHPLMIIACGTLLVMLKIIDFKCTWIYLVLLLPVFCGIIVAPSIHLVVFLNSDSFITFMWGETTECSFGVLMYQLFLAFVISFETVSIFVVCIYFCKTTFKLFFSVVRQSDSLNEDHDSVSEVGHKINQCNH